MINQLGERLQKLRTDRKISQLKVAELINVSPSIISNYESGERSPSIENLIKLASFYKCSTDYLLGLEKSDTSSFVDVSMLNEEQIRLLKYFLYSLEKYP